MKSLIYIAGALGAVLGLWNLLDAKSFHATIDPLIARIKGDKVTEVVGGPLTAADRDRISVHTGVPATSTASGGFGRSIAGGVLTGRGPLA